MSESEIFKVGDVVRNHQGHRVKITSVVQGNYGALIYGVFIVNEQSFKAYILPEMIPPNKGIYPWYNWPNKAWVEVDGNRFCSIAAMACENLDIDGYDLKWEETIRLIQEEREEREEQTPPSCP